MINLRFCFYILMLAIIGFTGVSAQEKEKNKTYKKEFCSENWSNNGKVSFNEVREMTLPAGSLTVDGKRNGGVKIASK
jgi:hypothetical protein